MTDELTDRIRARAVVWAGQITRLANKNLADKRKLIEVHSAVEGQGWRIGVVSTAKGITARAYEYGSGIHARLLRMSPKQLGPKGKILIKPKTKKVLAFYWEVATANPKQFIFAPDGRVMLPSVKHPGVKAVNGEKGYLAPAVNEVRKQVRRELPKEVREAALGVFRKSFRKSFGK